LDRIAVESSIIASIGSDRDTAILEVDPLNGSTYRYQGVPDGVYEEFMNSESKGNFFNRRIRAAGYPYQKVK
jgi:hypothetical protein